MRSKYIVIGIVVGIVLSSVVVVLAGGLDSPAAPGATSSYSLENIWKRLNDGTAGAQSTFTEPAAGPGTATMHTLNDIMAEAPAADNTDGAVPGEVLAGKKYWSLRTDGSGGSSWGLKTGTAAAGNNVNGADGAKTFTIPDGFYAGSKTCTANDADLLAGNIKQGVNIFGVDGTLTAGSTYNAGVPKTGQTASYLPGDDGALEKGVAWPNPRFTANVDNNGDGDCTDAGETCDGTVTDNLTGLIWLKNANCLGAQTWANALTNANGLASGSCGLADGSTAGMWRLPNVRELFSLIDFSRYDPALPSGHPFTGVQSDYYWSSTSYAYYSSFAWRVDLLDGFVLHDVKTDTHYVWPVRGGP